MGLLQEEAKRQSESGGCLRGQVSNNPNVSHQKRIKRGLFAIVLEYTRVVVRINL